MIEAAGGEAAQGTDASALTESTVEVRPAVPTDSLVLKVLLKQSLSEVQEAQFSKVDDGRARAYIDACIQEGACLVAVYQGAIIGSICLRTLQEIWSVDQFLNEEWFYVLPAFRGTGAAVKLLGTAEQLADQMGLPVFFAINSHDPKPLQEVLDNRAGYRNTGSNYLRHPRNGQQEVHHDDNS